MLEITILGSGSSGNSALVVSGETRVLIDAGLSCKQLCVRMEAQGVDPTSLDAILLTHEHGDHTKGIDVFSRKADIPLYCNPLTRETLEHGFKSEKTWRLVQTGAHFEIDAIRVETFAVPHDAVDPMGFVLRDAESSFGFVSDFGFATSLVRARLKEMNTIYIEANYDDVMLQKDEKRPWSTKQRIMARHGHLSNAQTAELIGSVCHDGLERVILGHLSKDCNTPEVAEAAVREALGANGAAHVEVLCAMQEEPTAWFRAAKEGTSIMEEESVEEVVAVTVAKVELPAEKEREKLTSTAVEESPQKVISGRDGQLEFAL